MLAIETNDLGKDYSRRLRDPGLTAPQRTALESELASVNGALEAMGDLDASSADPEDAKARREIGAAFVRRWKINAALSIIFWLGTAIASVSLGCSFLVPRHPMPGNETVLAPGARPVPAE